MEDAEERVKAAIESHCEETFSRSHEGVDVVVVCVQQPWGPRRRARARSPPCFVRDSAYEKSSHQASVFLSRSVQRSRAIATNSRHDSWS